MEEILNLLPVDGDARLLPTFFPREESDFFLEKLTGAIPWKQEPIRIMGKEVMQPRLTAWYGDEGKTYRYSGITMQPQPWTGELLAIRMRVEQVTGTRFNSVLLNFYRDGQDSMGWHRDNERELGVNPVIGSVSFGAPREFQFRHYRDKNMKIKMMLGHGSLLVMAGETQHHWLHALPKQSRYSAPRINLTFRTIF